MARFQVVEMFTSINGEGPLAGELALFIRMRGCNLCCAYCDTAWANRDDAKYEELSTEEIVESVRRAGIRNVTLTGGEPLLQEGIEKLLRALAEEPELRVEIETNGSIPLEGYADAFAAQGEGESAAGVLLASSETEPAKRPSITMDYKLPGSGMEERMRPENFSVLTPEDTVKFVVTDRSDLDRAREIIEEYHLTERCRVFISPVYGAIDPEEIVDYMKEHHLNDVTLQLQLHKIIWGADRRGV